MAKKSRPLWGLLIALFLGLAFTACRAPLTDDNLKRLSELEDLVSAAQNNLSWDVDDLQQRVDSMNTKLAYLRTHMKDSGDMRAVLMRYTAIQTNYETYIQQAPAIEYDLDKYRAEIIKLKDGALAGKISNKEFEKKYTEIRPPLTIMTKVTEPLWYNVLSVEPDYTRQNRTITERYKALGGK